MGLQNKSDIVKYFNSGYKKKNNLLIKKHIQTPNRLSWILTYLNKWKMIESGLFVLFIIIGFWNPHFFKIIFGVAYIPSLTMALWGTFMSRDALEYKLNHSKL